MVICDAQDRDLILHLVGDMPSGRCLLAVLGTVVQFFISIASSHDNQAHIHAHTCISLMEICSVLVDRQHGFPSCTAPTTWI